MIAKSALRPESWRWFALPIAMIAMIGSPAVGQTTAIVGATLIDGNGGPPVSNATIVIEGKRIVAVGARASVTVPTNARVIDAAGKFVTPGFIDINVHVTGGGFMEELFPLLLYGEKDAFKKYGYGLEAAQMALKFGVTTVRDTYGPLPPLLELRDEIARGEALGPRMQVAGTILGWGGPHQPDQGGPITPMQRRWDEYFQAYAPVGTELTAMYPDEARKAINQYLDKSPDFIKYGGTSHGCDPIAITFSPRVQRAIIEEAHKRGLKVDTHVGSGEGMLIAAEAGVDIITHAGLLCGEQEISDEILGVLREHKTICAIFANMSEGPPSEFLAATRRSPSPQDRGVETEASQAMWPLRANRDTVMPLMPKWKGLDFTSLEGARRNDKKLIDGGCIIAVGTDNSPGRLPEFGRQVPLHMDPGIGTITAIEGLVKLGMTPSKAIVAATRNGALAAGKLDQFGTLEVGKSADLLILESDPLADIRNIRKVERIMLEGQLIDPTALPIKPWYYDRTSERYRAWRSGAK